MKIDHDDDDDDDDDDMGVVFKSSDPAANNCIDFCVDSRSGFKDLTLHN
jgi:hypothetical protein